ncbi:MAG: DNA replication/repair protein RecF [Fimbriimonadaceae bacterium]|nr:DNA replication/repair protein RecF [Fimbriimonadaceae bacterium]
MDGVTVTSARYQDFRNLGAVVLNADRGVNLIVGPNAQGKTNLLEGLYLLSTGRLLRGSREAQAVRHGELRAGVEADLAPHGTTIRVGIEPGTRKRALVNGVALPRAADLIGRLPSVSFSSQDLAVVSGEPADRRHLLDTELSQVYPAYLKHLTIYKRALEQRNALLRRAQESYVDSTAFEVWEDQLAHHGEAMRGHRSAWVAELAGLASERHAVLGDGEVLSLSYRPNDEGDLANALASGRGHDVHRGSTGVGPHRDDLNIFVGGAEARHFGSQGQQRTAVVAIKLAVLALAVRTFGFPPMLLLDDIFSDLDDRRRAHLMEVAFDAGGQVFVTCTEAEQAGAKLLRTAKVFRVRSGRLEEE